MNTKNLTHENLSNFFGSQNLFYHPLFGRTVQYTDGVKFVSDNGANWLVIDIIANIMKLQKTEPFVAITITVKDKTAKLVFTDGNEKVLAKHNYSYTDFPLDTLTFFATDGILMLASEY